MYIHTYVRTHIHACMHACMHTDIHTYVCTYRSHLFMRQFVSALLLCLAALPAILKPLVPVFSLNFRGLSLKDRLFRFWIPGLNLMV